MILAVTGKIGQVFSAEVEVVSTFHILTLTFFLLAIVHAFFANYITRLSHHTAAKHAKTLKGKNRVSFLSEILRFFGEIEITFALWAIPLIITIFIFYGWDTVLQYLNEQIYVEPLFVVVIMSLASTRPIFDLGKKGIQKITSLFGNSPIAWVISILTLGPLLGSAITEPAAMTLSALLLQRGLFSLNPSKRLSYATLALLFVNFSVGSIWANFAAPPTIILSRCWNWNFWNFFSQFGWKAILGIFLVNVLYLCLFFKELKKLKKVDFPLDKKQDRVPLWVSLVHLLFLSWIIFTALYPPLFIGSFLLFLGFYQATKHHQYALNLKPPLLVGLFLAGLVIHANFQQWWIEPLLENLSYGTMFVVAMLISAINENATIAHLACLTDDLTPALKYALVSGLVSGGGLTVIAHTPNLVGQTLLKRHFGGGISPVHLFTAALIPSIIYLLLFYFFSTH